MDLPSMPDTVVMQSLASLKMRLCSLGANSEEEAEFESSITGLTFPALTHLHITTNIDCKSLRDAAPVLQYLKLDDDVEEIDSFGSRRLISDYKPLLQTISHLHFEGLADEPDREEELIDELSGAPNLRELTLEYVTRVACPDDSGIWRLPTVYNSLEAPQLEILHLADPKEDCELFLPMTIDNKSLTSFLHGRLRLREIRVSGLLAQVDWSDVATANPSVQFVPRNRPNWHHHHNKQCECRQSYEGGWDCECERCNPSWFC